MSRVFVLDAKKKPLLPCHPAKARQLLKQGKAAILQGKYAGTHAGRIAVRHRPSFKLNGFGVHPKYLRLLEKADGYEYAQKGGSGVSPPRLKAGAPDAA